MQERRRELEQERAGLLAPKSIRDGLQTPVLSLLEGYIAELRRVGRVEHSIVGVKPQISTLAKECPWRLLKDVTAESFRAWRQRERKKAPKTPNEYLISSVAFLNWLERTERIPRNPLRSVEKIANHGEPTFQRRGLALDEARRLVALQNPRSTVCLTALETGLRRGELEKLEWRDMHLAGDSPFLSDRRSTTKNHKPAPIPIDAELAAELAKIRPEGHAATQRVFAGCIPRMKRFRLDLREAGIESGEGTHARIDFHALRMTFQMLLTLNGTSPAWRWNSCGTATSS